MASSLLQAMEISASQFLDIFNHYDKDGNGFIEGKELQSFIRELREARQRAGLGLTDEMQQFVSECEKDSERRIGLIQLVQILPTEENFLLFFRQQLSSCSHFMQVWRRYDADHSGYIEADELKNFLKDLLLKAQRTCDSTKLDEYTAATLKIFDADGDGKLCLGEMSRWATSSDRLPAAFSCLTLCSVFRLLPDEQNFLLRFQGVKMPKHHFNRIFGSFDQDGAGFMDASDLDSLLRDVCEEYKVLDPADLPRYRSSIMELSDEGKLYRGDLCVLLCDEDGHAPSQ
ncbi:calbindin isoform X1 [Brachyistius frenatus]|uniref:calbindin isoform X1 n=1 Tax=Brachyistius frenatus TaxID=100188 RepID=UPI0037E95C12